MTNTKDEDIAKEAYVFLQGEDGDFQRQTGTLRALAELNRSKPLDGAFADKGCDWPIVSKYCTDHDLPYHPFAQGEDRNEIIDNFATPVYEEHGSVRIAIIADRQSQPSPHNLIKLLGDSSFNVTLNHV